MIYEETSKNGAIIFKKDAESKNVDSLLKTVDDLKKQVAKLEKRIKALETTESK